MTKQAFFALCLLLTSSSACHYKEQMFPNKLSNDANVFNVLVEDSTTAKGQSYEVTTTNTFRFFGTTTNTFTVFDIGLLTTESSATAPDLTGYTPGGLTNTPAIAPIAIDQTSITEGQYEIKNILATDHYLDADGRPLSIDYCIFEELNEMIGQYNNFDQDYEAKELLMVTWLIKEGGTVTTSQLVLAHVSSTQTYAVMYYESDNTASSTIYLVANGDYSNVGALKFAQVCNVAAGTSLDGKSNDRCAKKNSVVFNLGATGGCTDAGICGDPITDYDSRNKDCTELTEPKSHCALAGYCFYTPTVGTFKFNFTIRSLYAKKGSFSLVDSTNERLDGGCHLGPGDKDLTTGDVTITKDIDTASAALALCGIVNNGDGSYTVYLLNHDLGAVNLFDHDSMVYEVKCRPADWVTRVSIGVTIGGDIDLTTLPTPTGRTLTCDLANRLDPTKNNFQDLDLDKSATSPLGRPLYPYCKFEPGDYSENVSPLAIAIKRITVADNGDFTGNNKVVIFDNGCTNDALTLFKMSRECLGYIKDDTYGKDFYSVCGSFPAARWTSSPNLYIQFIVSGKPCTYTEYFENSYCGKSCNGNGYNIDGEARVRRDVDSNTDFVLTAHIRITDSPDDESSSACADQTLAYAAITVLVVILLVATAFTVLLFLKLRANRKSK